MRAPFLHLVLLPLAIALAPRCEAQSSRVQELVGQIRKERNSAEGAWFRELGEMKTLRSLRALKQCLKFVDGGRAQQQLMNAFLLFRGDPELEPQAIETLEDEALDKQPGRARTATTALTRFGPAARPALFDVVYKARDANARATALKPILVELRSLGGAERLQVGVWNYQIGVSGSYAQLLEFIHHFQEPRSLRTLVKAVNDEELELGVRAAVLDAMATAPLDGEAGEAVEHVVGKGLFVKDSRLRYHALNAAAQRGNAVHKTRITELTRSDDDSVRRAAHVALARIRIAQSEDALDEILLLVEEQDPIARQAAALSLAEVEGHAADKALLGLLHDPDFTVRAVALELVTRARRNSAIPALIQRLETATGRDRSDVAKSLRLLSGVDHGRNPRRWDAWWSDHAAGFQVPTLDAALAAEAERQERRTNNSTQASFYGLEVVSDHVAFVIDTSGSMSATAYQTKTRLDIAKQQLSGALSKLSHLDAFALVPFSSGVSAWKRELVPCDDEARDDANAFVEGLRAGGGTAIFDALERAFEFEGIDTIFLLTDGDPSGGRIVDKTEIRREVEHWNLTRHVRIHCISVGQDRPWLKLLAESTGGEYRVESK